MPNSPSARPLPASARRFDHGTRVAVFGATGYIGAHLVPRLLREGCAVRASGRNRKVLDARDWSGVESVEADALMPDSLHAALAGVDTAYYLVHSMAAGQDFGRLDVQAAKNFAAAAPGRCASHRLPRRSGSGQCRFRAPGVAARDGDRLRSGRVP
jgi:uncharacterized protein YbjT (DUF2867 family)